MLVHFRDVAKAVAARKVLVGLRRRSAAAGRNAEKEGVGAREITSARSIVSIAFFLSPWGASFECCLILRFLPLPPTTAAAFWVVPATTTTAGLGKGSCQLLLLGLEPNGGH